MILFCMLDALTKMWMSNDLKETTISTIGRMVFVWINLLNSLNWILFSMQLKGFVNDSFSDSTNSQFVYLNEMKFQSCEWINKQIIIVFNRKKFNWIDKWELFIFKIVFWLHLLCTHAFVMWLCVCVPMNFSRWRNGTKA